MNHLPFIAASYGVTIAAVLLLTLWSWRAMRRAETKAEGPRREP